MRLLEGWCLCGSGAEEVRTRRQRGLGKPSSAPHAAIAARELLRAKCPFFSREFFIIEELNWGFNRNGKAALEAWQCFSSSLHVHVSRHPQPPLHCGGVGREEAPRRFRAVVGAVASHAQPSATRSRGVTATATRGKGVMATAARCSARVCSLTVPHLLANFRTRARGRHWRIHLASRVNLPTANLPTALRCHAGCALPRT